MKQKIFLYFGLLSFCAAPVVHARNYDFSVLGALTHSGYLFSDESQTMVTRKIGWGGGFTAGMELDPFLTLESGLLFLNHEFSLTTGGVTQDKTLRFLDLPIFLRFAPLNQVALYFGPYFGLALGSSQSDFGAMGGFGWRYALGLSTKLRLDALYQFGLAFLDSTQSTQRSRNFIFLAGVQFEAW
jgi:hypothetical protein